jgi:hypothetical protein
MSNIKEIMDRAYVAYTTKDIDRAISLYQQALLEHPEHPKATSYLGYMLGIKGKHDAARAFTQRAAAMLPEDVPIQGNHGNTLLRAGDYDEAITVLEKIVTAVPDSFAYNRDLAKAYREKGLIEKSIQLLDRCLGLKPNDDNILVEKAVCLLHVGRFKEAWPIFHHRWEISKISRPAFDTALLTSLDQAKGKTVLVYSEQGFGDAIQCARHLPLLKKMGCTIYFACRTPLLNLFKDFPGIDKVLDRDSALPPHDYNIPIFDLMALFTPTLDKINPVVPFPVAAQPILSSALNTKKFKVGICWAGSPTHANDRWRSCPLGRFHPLLGMKEVSFFSLQMGPRSKDLFDQGFVGLIENMAPFIKDFADTAAIINKLDLVITVDTSVAHLAASLNKPTWVMISHNNDWRWGIGKTTTDWYPTMKLYRPLAPGDWESIMERVEKDLQLTLPRK